MGVYKNNNGNLELISGATLYADAPIGAISAFGGATAPQGWLLCHGQAISRTDYAELFAVIGTAYGSGDGSTTFNVPDGREATIKGAGLTGLSNNHMDADGLAVGEFIDDRLQAHVHKDFEWSSGTAAGVNATLMWNNGAAATSNNKTFGVEDARSGDTTEVKAVGANWIIKAQQVALPADFMGALDNKQDATDDNLETTDKTVVGAINELKDDLSTKQNKTDNNLTTTSKQIVGAINEINSDLLKINVDATTYDGITVTTLGSIKILTGILKPASLVSLASNIRPRTYVGFLAVSANTGNFYNCWLGTNGEFTITGSPSSSDQLMFTVAYA